MFHSAVDQAPGIPLHAGRQATGELRGRKRLMTFRSDVTLLTVAATCNLPGTFSMSVSCSRSLASLSIGRASNDKSQSQLPKLCLRLASSMVMILEKRSRCANQRTTTQCECVCVLSGFYPALTSQLQEAGSPKKLSIMSSSSFSTTTNPCSRASFPYTSGDHWTKNEYRWSTLKQTHRTLGKGC